MNIHCGDRPLIIFYCVLVQHGVPKVSQRVQIEAFWFVKAPALVDFDFAETFFASKPTEDMSIPQAEMSVACAFASERELQLYGCGAWLIPKSTICLSGLDDLALLWAKNIVAEADRGNLSVSKRNKNAEDLNHVHFVLCICCKLTSGTSQVQTSNILKQCCNAMCNSLAAKCFGRLQQSPALDREIGPCFPQRHHLHGAQRSYHGVFVTLRLDSLKA